MLVRVGQIVNSFGLDGRVKVLPLTDFLERFEKGARLRLHDDWVTIDGAQWHKDQLLLKLSGIDDRTAADKLKWAYVEAEEMERPELDDDEYFTDDLLGMKVKTVEGEDLGTVDDVLGMPAQDVLVVGQIMIPAVKQFVKGVDVSKREITVELIPGMRPGES